MSDLPHDYSRNRGRLEAQSVEIALLRRRIAELESLRLMDGKIIAELRAGHSPHIAKLEAANRFLAKERDALAAERNALLEQARKALETDE